MQVVAIPAERSLTRKDRWFADRIHFLPDGGAVLLDMVFHRFAVPKPNQAIGSLRPPEWDHFGAPFAIILGQFRFGNQEWNSFEHAVWNWEESWQRTWRNDFTCVAYGIGGRHEHGVFEIHLDDPHEVDSSGLPTVRRVIEPSPDVASVSSLAFSPDGRWLYAVEEWLEEGRGPGKVTIGRADVRAMFRKRVLEKHSVNRLTNQPFTQRLVSPGSFTRFASLPHGTTATTISPSPGNRSLAVGTTTGDTHLVRVRGGEPLAVLKRKRRKRTADVSVRRIAFSPSGKQLGVVVDGGLRVWEVKTMELLWEAEDDTSHVLDLAYHPAGNVIALARSDGAAVFLDALTGKVLHRYAWKVGQLNSVAFSPDGLTCAAGGENGQVVVWDVDV